MAKSNSARTKSLTRGIILLPSLLTTCSLFAGFYAVVTAMKGHYIAAAIAIFVGMIMDSLDGRVARMTNTETSFGAELDSLSDMVTFGVAPALVIYSWALHHLGKIGWLAAFVYTIAAALRLARFNTQIERTDCRYFQGLPSPAAAGVIAGLVWSCNRLGWNNWLVWVIAAVLTIAAGTLMVSNIRYRSFKDLDLKNRVRFLTILITVLLLVLVATRPAIILFLAFFGYFLSGIFTTLWQRHRKKHLQRKRRRQKHIKLEK